MLKQLFVATNQSYTSIETDSWTIIPKFIWVSKSKISVPFFDETGRKIDRIVATIVAIHVTKWIAVSFNKSTAS